MIVRPSPVQNFSRTLWQGMPRFSTVAWQPRCSAIWTLDSSCNDLPLTTSIDWRLYFGVGHFCRCGRPFGRFGFLLAALAGFALLSLFFGLMTEVGMFIPLIIFDKFADEILLVFFVVMTILDVFLSKLCDWEANIFGFGEFYFLTSMDSDSRESRKPLFLGNLRH